jgi:imidazolonepropionase-like amidohydrolase
MQLLQRLFSAALVCLGLASPAQAAELAVIGAKIYTAPDAPPIERGTVLMRDGRITAVGPAGQVAVPGSAQRIAGSGAVVVAGFWNSHVHMLPVPLREATSRPAAELSAALQAMFTHWGFTTVFDIGSLPGNTFALRRRVEAGEVTGPMILTTDALFFPEGGTPVYVRELFEQLHVPSMEVTSAAQAQARARAQLAQGADGVKLMAGAIVGGPTGVLPMDPAIAAAIVREAHSAGKPAFAHPTNTEGLEVSIASGVDVLAHTTPTAGPWSAEFAARLVGKGMALTPTLSLFEEGLQKEGASPEVVKRYLDASQQQVAAFVQAGGQLLFGTDIGYIELADTTREYELMAGAGLGWQQILASLTTQPAQRFGQAKRKGRIAVGLDADLVVLASDPARKPTALADVKYTIRGGKVVYQALPASVR